MDTKYKRYFSIALTIGIVGLTAYAIKKHYDSKKQDEESIGLDEARDLVKDDERRISNLAENEEILEDDLDMENVKFGARDQAHYDPNFKRLNSEQIEEIVDEARDMVDWNASFTRKPIGIKPEELAASQEEVEEEREEDWFEGPDPEEIHDSKGYFEENKDVIDDLRYEPNSVEAREQFINMELANLGRDNDTRDIVAMLYDHPFIPMCDEDQNLKTRLMDHRIKFFGMVSRWTRDISYGDVVMYYGKSAEYNCGNDVKHWVDYFLTCADINDLVITSDEIEEHIGIMNAHLFHNKDLDCYGLFGLTAEQMNAAADIASKRIDGKLTYDIEFHQFVQGVI